MNQSSLLRASVALAVGLLLGFVASTLAFRYRLIGLPHENFLQKMDRLLDLTPAERGQIMDIVEETRDKIRSARHDFKHRRRDQIQQAHARIRALLRPDQQARFDKYFEMPRGLSGGPDHCEPHGGPP